MRTIEIKWEIAEHQWSMASVGGDLEIVRNDARLPLTLTEVKALAAELRGFARGHGRALPANAGKPWTHDADKLLTKRWKGGETVVDIASELERTKGAIKARLIGQGLASADDLLLA